MAKQIIVQNKTVEQPSSIGTLDFKQKLPYIPPKYFTEDFMDLMREHTSITDTSSWAKDADPFKQAANIAVEYEHYAPTWERDPTGKLTIGYGGRDNDPRYDGMKSIDKLTAYNMMQGGFSSRHEVMMKKYPAYAAMNPNERGAFLDFTYNFSNGNIAKDNPDLLHYLSDKKYIPQIIQLMPDYRLGEGRILNGLERRRADDVNLALQKDSKEYLPLFYKGGGY